jgi:hypothetical protein
MAKKVEEVAVPAASAHRSQCSEDGSKHEQKELEEVFPFWRP